MALNEITVFASEILCAVTYSVGTMAVWCLGFGSHFMLFWIITCWGILSYLHAI